MTRPPPAPPPTPRRSTAALLLVLVVALAVVVGLRASPASAHGGPGALVVDVATPAADGASVHVEVSITFINDGEAADRATVHATATGPDGSASAPVELTPTATPGTYAGDVPVTAPGDWTVLVTSTFPPAEAQVAVPVGGAAATGAPVTTIPTSAAPTTAAPTNDSGAPAASAANPAPGTLDLSASPADDDSSDGNTSTGLWVGVGVALVAGAAGVTAAVRRWG